MGSEHRVICFDGRKIEVRQVPLLVTRLAMRLRGEDAFEIRHAMEAARAMREGFDAEVADSVLLGRAPRSIDNCLRNLLAANDGRLPR